MSKKNNAISDKNLNKASGGKIDENPYAAKKYKVYHDETGAPAGEYDDEYTALKVDADINNRYIKSNDERVEYRHRYNNFLNNNPQ